MGHSDFWDHLYISGTAKATNLKFGVQIDYNEYNSQQEAPLPRRAQHVGHA